MFAGFVARMEDTILPKCVVFGGLVGVEGCVGGQEKEWTRCFLDDIRAFGINANQWTTAAQDERKWRTTAEQAQGVERFMVNPARGLLNRGKNKKSGNAVPQRCMLREKPKRKKHVTHLHF